jgi:magnesium chelatase family protein
MLATAKTFTLDGISARPVRVEVDVHRGLPAFSIVGLPDVAVREARERIRAALANSGFEFPMGCIVANLAPASLRKSGLGLDLALATALLVASGQLAGETLSRVPMVGELALDGSTRPVPGALVIAEAAREQAAEAVVVPVDNGPEAALADGIDVIGLDRLRSLPAFAAGEWRSRRPEPMHLRLDPSPDGPDFADLRGQSHLRRGLEIAAAGGHSLLMIGSPGSGKTLAACRLPSILPPLTKTEALEITRIFGACRMKGSPPGARPFRAPHHTISPVGLVGGGRPPRPGEATIAHRGILYLDELCEFRRDSLEALRTPLATGEVRIDSAAHAYSLPARFMLVAGANPCPCGRGEFDCTCAPVAIRRYRSRLHGAFAERIEILCFLRPPSTVEIGGNPGETSAEVRERVSDARAHQEHRLGRGRCNADMTPLEASECLLSLKADTLLGELCIRRRLPTAPTTRRCDWPGRSPTSAALS